MAICYQARVLTMCAIVSDGTTHTHGRRTFKQTFCDYSIGFGDARKCTGDCQDTVVNALNDLGNTSLDSSLIPQIRNVLACFANDDASFSGGDNSSKGQLRLRIFLLRLGYAILHIELVERVGQAARAIEILSVGDRHDWGNMRSNERSREMSRTVAGRWIEWQMIVEMGGQRNLCNVRDGSGKDRVGATEAARRSGRLEVK